MDRYTAFLLSDDRLESYSPSERKLFNLLPQSGKPATSLELTKAFYNGKSIPVNGPTIVRIFLIRLQAKVARNRESFRIASTKRRGARTQWCFRRLPRR
jgi:hypothetical protein